MSSALSQFKSRGRAYQCKRCGKVDRRGRVIGHILKHHVPFDKVPFSCSLCSFRCQDKQPLLEHIKKYRRHREEEAKSGIPDYSKCLKMSSEPYYVGDADLVQLSKEESVKWFGRNLQTQDEYDGLFEDDEDDVVVSGGLSIPRWLVSSSHSRTLSSACQDVQASVVTTSATRTPLVSLPFTQTLQMTVPPQVAQQIPMRVFKPVEVISQPNSTVKELNTINTSDLNSEFHQQPHFQESLRSNLDTPPVLHVPSPTRYIVTPCLDENILPGLMSFDKTDPLFAESEEVPVNAVISPEPLQKRARREIGGFAPISNSNQHDGTSTHSSSNTFVPTSSSEGQAATQGQSQTSFQVPQLDSLATLITSAIKDGAKLIADALDSNTRAIRCQEKTHEKIVDELSRIERKIHQLERTIAEKSDNKSSTSAVLKPGQENKAPKNLKSVVSSVKSK